ncbi:MAG: Organic solvent tolerance protein OstA, partial [Cytophaga sp.]|nr:Organic solvent tolerance protein OstA [Cytophaga sp.]
MLKRPVFLLLLFSILCAPALAQKKVKLKKADKLRGGTGSNGERVDWVVGNVVFVQNKTTIYCDSAQIYRERNAVDAYGRIRITEGDSVTVTAKSLSYDGNEKIA